MYYDSSLKRVNYYFIFDTEEEARLICGGSIMIITGIYEIVSENLIGFNTQYGSTLYINFDNISFFYNG